MVEIVTKGTELAVISEGTAPDSSHREVIGNVSGSA